MMYCKSPFNYTGGKYKMLPQLFGYFPERTGTVVDLFAGGGDVFANAQGAMHPNRIIANDINYYVIDIFKEFQQYTIDDLLEKIDGLIEQWNLSSTNVESFLAFREHYNKTKNPIELFVLVCHSFNHQFRFNSRHDFNTPFGRERSWFNPKLRENLVNFHKAITGIELVSNNFKTFDLNFLSEGDFIYADPPYLITTGSYNDGKRGFEGWSEQEDLALFRLLDRLHKKGVMFALSNVLEHKGRENNLLKKWAKKYQTHIIDYNYKNSNYHAKNTDKITIEVLITNY